MDNKKKTTVINGNNGNNVINGNHLKKTNTYSKSGNKKSNTKRLKDIGFLVIEYEQDIYDYEVP